MKLKLMQMTLVSRLMGGNIVFSLVFYYFIVYEWGQ